MLRALALPLHPHSERNLRHVHLAGRDEAAQLRTGRDCVDAPLSGRDVLSGAPGLTRTSRRSLSRLSAIALVGASKILPLQRGACKGNVHAGRFRDWFGAMKGKE